MMDDATIALYERRIDNCVRVAKQAKKDLGQRSFGCKLQIQFLENYAEILKLPEKYYMLENIIKLETLYKRDTKGKVRVWEVEYGQGPRLLAGTRTISGTQDGQKVTSEWNMSAPKNVGKANETTALSQAKAEAQALWDKRIEKSTLKMLTASTLMSNSSQCLHMITLNVNRIVDGANLS